jgi:propanol-preferring alcohol dehydrogenase
VSAEKLRLARAVGAHETVESGPAAAAAIADLTGGLGAELVVDFVGADATMALAAAAVRRGGDVAIVGLGGGSLRYALGTLPFDAGLTTPYWGSATELMEVLALARAGLITTHTERFPLERVAEAYDRLRDGTLDGRAVVCP